MNLNVKDNDGRYPLYYAVLRKDIEAINFLLESSHSNPITADVVAVAAGFDDETILKLILATSGGNCSQVDPETGNTPLHLAIKSQNRIAACALVKLGASLMHKNKKGWTPGLLACWLGLDEALDLMLRRDRSVFEQTHSGNNTLHLASIHGNEHCVLVLRNHQFPMNVKNSEGKKAKTLAGDNLAVLASLEDLESLTVYDEFSNQIHEAILTQDLSSISTDIDEWPLNIYFSIEISGKKHRGTLLHLLLTGYRDVVKLKQLADRIFNKKSIDRSLRDDRGNSYAHLLVAKDIDPIPYKLSIDEVNHAYETPLHWAAKNENPFVLKCLVKELNQLHLNSTDRIEQTPLFHAILNNRFENVKILVGAGANVEHRSLNGITPLILASGRGNYQITKCLVEHGADINQSGRRAEITPLAVSLQSSHEDVPLFLLFNGAKVDKVISGSETLGHEAAATGKIYVLRFLSEQGVSLSAVNKSGMQPVHTAAAAGKVRILKYLNSIGISLDTPVVTKDSNVNNAFETKEVTSLHVASTYATVKVIRWLIENGANPAKATSSGPNLLICALENTEVNSQQIIELYKEYLFSQDLKQLLPAVHVAISRDYVDPLKLLLEIGIPIHTQLGLGNTALHLACRESALHVTSFLLNRGANMNEKNDVGMTPIELAAANNAPSQFRLMLDHLDSSLDDQNDRGETLMHLAVRAGNLSHFVLLMKRGANFDLQDGQGMTPLHVASQGGFVEIVKVLLIAGANANLKTTFSSLLALELGNAAVKLEFEKFNKCQETAPKRSTPLHLAVRSQHLLSVQLFADECDINFPDGDGFTPLQLAVTIDSVEIVRILRENGAIPLEQNIGPQASHSTAQSSQNQSSVERRKTPAVQDLDQKKPPPITQSTQAQSTVNKSHVASSSSAQDKDALSAQVAIQKKQPPIPPSRKVQTMVNIIQSSSSPSAQDKGTPSGQDANQNKPSSATQSIQGESKVHISQSSSSSSAQDKDALSAQVAIQKKQPPIPSSREGQTKVNVSNSSSSSAQDKDALSAQVAMQKKQPPLPPSREGQTKANISNSSSSSAQNKEALSEQVAIKKKQPPIPPPRQGQSMVNISNVASSSTRHDKEMPSSQEINQKTLPLIAQSVHNQSSEMR